MSEVTAKLERDEAGLNKLLNGLRAEIQRLEEVDRYAPLKASSRFTAERLQGLLDDFTATEDQPKAEGR